MSFDVTGKLVEKFDEQQVNDTFKKREFVIEVNSYNNASTYTDYLKFQLVQDKCSLIESFSVGSQVKVHFNLKGRKWEKDGNTMYFNMLDAWRIENDTDQEARPFDDGIVVPENEDVPF
jgi:hypothetical protein